MPTLENYREKILGFYRRHRRMPSYGEIASLLGFRSKNAAVKLVSKLLKLGVVAKDASGRLIPKNIGDAIRVLGIVEAGWPSPAEEELIDTMSLDEYLIHNKEATYILKVSGDSMIEAGILPGDQVLVERGAEAKDGDIVIAEVDGAWTMKFFRKRGGKIVLVPGNKKYKPIIPKEELQIAAVVKAVIRKY
jgi:SOS regulatory protein LexA